jgi:Xaa-Pro aminopeptidase
MSRISNIQELMGVQKLDLLLLSSAPNILYVTGFDTYPRPNYVDSPNSTYFVVVPGSGSETTLLAPRIEELFIRSPVDKLWNTSVEYYGESFVESNLKQRGGTPVTSATLIQTLARILKNRKKQSRIGVELDVLPYEFQTQLAKELGKSKFVNAGPLLRKARMIKSDEEISLLRDSIRINELACSKLIDNISEDADISDLARIYETALVHNGARLGMSSLGAGSKFGAIPIARPRAQKLIRGDLVRLDLCGVYKGYWSDMARSLFVGEASSEKSRIYQAYRKAELKGVNSVKPHRTAREIFKVVQGSLTEAGLWTPGFVGHGIGLNLHEDPTIGPKSNIQLQPGMVLSIEVFYFREGFGGLQIEDNVLVTKDGFEPLTSLTTGQLESH